MPFTILQPMHYMQNIDIRGILASGVLTQPRMPVDTPLAHVDLRGRRRGCRAASSATPPHHCATYELCGDDLHSARELAADHLRRSRAPRRRRQVPLPRPVDGGPRVMEPRTTAPTP